MSTSVTHIEKKKMLAPKLRFKFFLEEWHSRNLSSFINFIPGYAFNSEEMKSIKSKYQLIKMSNVYKSELDLSRSPSYWEEIDERLEKYLLRKKDILLTLTGTVGKRDYGYSVVIPEDNKFLLNQRLVCLRYLPNISDGDFINYLIKTSRFYYLFYGESKGGTGNQTNVGSEDLKNIKLNIPTLPEQKKIASFLSTVDEKIQQLTRKKALLTEYKKGVMQQLFSGKLRFKDEKGKAFPEWGEKRLGDVLEIGSGRDYKHLSNGDVPVFGTGGLMTTVNDFLYDGETVCIGRKGTIDKPMYYRGKIWTVDTLFYTHKFRNSIPKFIYFLFQQINWKLYNEASGVPSLSKTTIERLSFSFPSIDEQKKIADYLSNLDTKIEIVNNEITQTQNFKKGLLQQMFV